MAPSHGLEPSRRSIMRVNPQRASTERKSRKSLSCDPCRRRKVKCDRSTPCDQCIRHRTTESCQYTTRAPRQTAPQPVSSLVSSLSDLTPTSQVAKAPSPQGLISSLEASCASGHNRQNENLSCSPRSPRGGFTGAVGLDSTIQSLGPSSFPGSGETTRFFGRSHWALTVDMFPDLREHLRKYHEVKQNHAASQFFEFSEYLSMRQSKKLMRQDLMYRTQIHPSLQPPNLQALLPDRHLADRLVGLYFSSFETTFRILHRVQFLTEYDNFHRASRKNSSSSAWSTDIFAAKLLALMACASCFARNNIGPEMETIYSPERTAKEWIQAVVSWVKLLTNRAILSLDIIQIECLLLLAQQAVGHEGDFSWLAGGSLVRNAIVIGLHRDPSHYKAMSPYWGEMRRRIWATIVELDLQAALSLGAPVSISRNEYDCRPPSNLDDEDLRFDALTLPTPQPRTTLTGTSFLAILAETFNTRAHIARLVNSVRVTAGYVEILKLSDGLTNHISNLPPALSGVGDGGRVEGSGFRKSLFLFLMYRSLLALHRPFFLSLSESGSKMYDYSQKICVQASLAILSPLASFLERYQSTEEPVSGHYYLHLKGGMFRDELFHAAATLCFEIRLKSKENSVLPVLGSDVGSNEQYGQSNPECLFQPVKHCINYFELKVRTEKQASKSFMLLHMFYASAKHTLFRQKHRYQPRDEFDEDFYTLEQACPRASRRCRELLLHGVTDSSPKDTEQSGRVTSSLENNGTQPADFNESLRQPGFAPMSSYQEMAPFSLEELGPEFYDLAMDWDAVADPFNMFSGGDFWPVDDPLM